jgi:hypothetical protein
MQDPTWAGAGADLARPPFTKSPECPFRVACIERLESKGTRRLPKVMWIAWIGQDHPKNDLWQRYLRRYAVDHWYVCQHACIGQHDGSTPNVRTLGAI